jgi:outer membrane protein assembly factor BamB
MKLLFNWVASPALLALVLSLQSTSAKSDADHNWPQWRGPSQTGVAPAADPPTTWSESENIKWKVTLPGSGNATPIIWGDQIFIQAAIGTGKKVEAAKTETDSTPPPPGGRRGEGPGPGGPPPGGPGPDGKGPGGPPPGGFRGPGGPGGGRGRFGGPPPSEIEQFVLICLDRKTGKTLWQQVAKEELPHEGFKEGDGSFASPSGLTDGKNVYAYFGSHGLYCYNMSGKLQWSQDLGKMKIALGFGEGSSPTLYKDTLIVTWDNEDGSFITALDKNTGKTLWKEKREERTSWATPVVVQHDGKAEVVTAATGRIRSYDIASGKLLWECGGLLRNVIPSPVADGEKVYCMSGFQGSSLLAIKLGGSGDLTGSDSIAWTHKKSTPYVPSPLLYDGKLYFCAVNNGRISCLDSKSGKVMIDAEPLEDLQMVYASPVGAGGKIYLPDRNGVTVVLKQSDKLEKLATNKLDDKFDASPAAVGKELFLRGRQNLYCIAEK